MALFTTVKKAKVRKTAFNLSHERKQTMEMGKLTPILCEEVVPGDKWIINTQMMVKLAPMVAPIMHRIDLYIHYFFVPNRIIWDGWEDFITGEAATSVPTRTLNQSYLYESTLMDYLGLPVNTDSAMTTGDYTFSQLPFRAYYSIWNEYYRDQNFESEVDINSITPTGYTTLKWRAWPKDYFTSALPWAQKGSPVTLPGDVSYKSPTEYSHEDDSTVNAGDITGAPDAGSIGNLVSNNAGSPKNIIIDNIDEVQIDINELRTAVRLQRWLERNARAGTRYTEHLLAHWGVKSKDASLQRPEFLGGGKTPIVISEVLQTSESGTTPQGTPTGHGIGVGNTNRAVKYFEEHGWIMAIASIIPKPAYYQGLHRKFTRTVNTDFYYPEFANLGEQEVKNKEILWKGTGGGSSDEDTFGYQSRFAEYKYMLDSVHGEFRDTLRIFHLGRKFTTVPSLNSTFITTEQQAPDLEQRIFAAGRDSDPFWCQIYHNIKAIRPMPYYGTPSLM